MISELFIKKYRGLENINLNNLGQVNIIAGANNTGKTSILEIIESLESVNSLRAWRTIGKREGSASRISTPIYDTIKSLFPMKYEGKTTSISYSGMIDEKPFDVELTAQFTETILNEEEIENISGHTIRSKTMENTAWNESFEYELELMNIHYYVNNQACGSDILYSIQRFFSQNTHPQVALVDNIIYVSPTQHAQNTFYLNALMTDAELYEEFVEVMKAFDPDFISINSVDDERTFTRKYVVLSKKFKEGLLLNAYGDGMKKAMLLLSAMLKAKNGILLLDEFETAIHISVMGKVFKWLMETAVKLNVQVFMTSHSIEAISEVLKCCPDLQHDMRMVTLVNTSSGIKVRNIDAKKAVQLMDEYGMELR